MLQADGMPPVAPTDGRPIDGQGRFVPPGADALPFNQPRVVQPAPDGPALDPKYEGKTIQDVITMHEEAQRRITQFGTENAQMRRDMETLSTNLNRVLEMVAAAPDGDPDPEDDPPNPADNLPTRRPVRGGQTGKDKPLTEADVRAILAARDAQAHVETTWEAFRVSKGLSQQDVVDVMDFFRNPENLTPEFLYAARHMHKQLDETRRQTARGLQEGFQRTLQDTRTIAGNVDSRPSMGSLQSQLAEAEARGDRKAVDRVRRQIYGVQ